MTVADPQQLRILLSHIYAWPEQQRGAERYLHTLGRFLIAAGHDVQLLTTAETGYSEVLDGVATTALPRRLARPRKYGAQAADVGFAKSALRYAARRRYDVWHATSIGDATAAVNLSTVRATRTVFTDHGFPARDSRERRSDHASFVKVVTQVQDYLCMSQPAADLLWTDYRRSARIIPPGVDTDCFIPASRRTQRPTILYSGSLEEPRKNVALLAEAFGLLLDERPDAQLWLAGPGDPTSSLTALSPELGSRISVLGTLTQTELIERYQAAWVTALPSDSEVFGMALAESLSCGTPGVGLDDGLGPASILTKDTGALAERSSQGIANALNTALDLAHRPKTLTACRTRALDFDWARVVVPAIEAVYRAGVTHAHHAH